MRYRNGIIEKKIIGTAYHHNAGVRTRKPQGGVLGVQTPSIFHESYDL